MKLFKKTLVIGLDCAITHLIEKHIAEGVLPNFQKLFEGGVVCDNALVPYPTITPPNWASIATGAYPGTHGVTDFWVHLPGTTPLANNVASAFNSKWYQAETMWEAGERMGKKSIVFNYPGSFPPKGKDTIIVGGRGLSLGLVYDGHKHMEKHIELAGEMLFTTDSIYGTVKTNFVDAGNWQNVDDMGDDPLESEIIPNFPHSISTFAPATWYLLLRDLDGDGYDTVTLSPTRNMQDAFFTLKKGQWSDKIFANIQADDKAQEVSFKGKLLRLSEDAEDFSLYVSPLVLTRGWSYPPEIDEELRDIPYVLGNSGGYIAYTQGWIDPQTWIELTYEHSAFNGEAARRLLHKHEWDIFFMHNHPPDWTYHMLMTDLDMQTAASKEAYELAWRLHREMYIATDQMLGTILTESGDDVCVVLVSDHGAVMDGPQVNPYDILGKAGLISFEGSESDLDTRGLHKGAMNVNRLLTQKPDVTKSVALPQRAGYVYVNLKGRYPGGIVEPEDYKKVQDQIIDALYQYKHPKTGERCISLALNKEDARLLGLHGEGIGDVVYAVKPEYSSQHGNILPTATWGIGSLHALLSFYGPGIKKGHRLQRTCNITDMVPTLCYGGDFPLPEQCEGSVIYQIFDNPNFKMDN